MLDTSWWLLDATDATETTATDATETSATDATETSATDATETTAATDDIDAATDTAADAADIATDAAIDTALHVSDRPGGHGLGDRVLPWGGGRHLGGDTG